MKRIALVRGESPSGWTSCQSITGNLSASYRLGFPGAEIQPFGLHRGMSRHEGFAAAERIFEFQPEAISFIDHEPPPGVLLRALAEAYGNKPLPELVIHVFGDFSLHPNDWIKTKPVLTTSKVRFICASEKQCRLVHKLIDAPAEAVRWIPFPVNESNFSFSAEEVGRSRETYGLKKEDWVFLYTGRLSAQKNVTLLLNVFGNYLKQVDSNAQLWVAGRPDDLGIPYLGFKPSPGWLSSQLLARTSPRIRYLGDLGPSELRALHHATDCYISLSTHNDEDFGMAPAEAAMCGSPLLLTNWGGFSSFSKIGQNACSLVPVKIGARSVLPEAADVMKAMLLHSSRRPSLEQRAQIAARTKTFCSIEAIARQISEYLQTPVPTGIRGFTPSFLNMARAHRTNPAAPFLQGVGYSTLYRQVYEAYL